jgi:hypothetical protein
VLYNRQTMLYRASSLTVQALLAVTAFEIADAAGVGDWRGIEVVSIVAFIALLASAGVALLFAYRGGVPRSAALLGPAAGIYLLAFFFSYDPYFGSTVRRYSEGRSSGVGWWVAGVVAAAVAIGLLTRRFPRLGAAATVVVPFVVLLSVMLVAGGD